MRKKLTFALYFQKVRAVSSVGLEHYLDRVGVTGSNPVQLTIFIRTPKNLIPFSNNLALFCQLLLPLQSFIFFSYTQYANKKASIYSTSSSGCFFFM